jgi:hypothetical protein
MKELENTSVKENDRKTAEIVSLMFGKADKRVEEVMRLFDPAHILTYPIGEFVFLFINNLVSVMPLASKQAWRM